MKPAISNIALPQFFHADDLPELFALGFRGLEVAPSRIWGDTWHGLTAAEVQSYRRDVERSGLQVVGFHSLLFDQPELELCGAADTRDRLLAFFVHLSAICRDLGGRTLIWGGGRKRGNTTYDDAKAIALEFFATLADRTAAHGTVFCIEPLTPADTDFINSVRECDAIAREIDRPGFKVQIDAKALAGNGELTAEIFSETAENLVHFHANEPGFEVLGSSGTVDHRAAGGYLRSIGYEGFVSIEQKMIGPDDPFAAIRKSYSVLQECYL